MAGLLGSFVTGGRRTDRGHCPDPPPGRRAHQSAPPDQRATRSASTGPIAPTPGAGDHRAPDRRHVHEFRRRTKKVNDPSGSLETLQASGKTAQSGAPTDGDILHQYTVPVFGGTVINPQSPGDEDMIPGGTILGVKVNAPQSVNCYLTVVYEE